MLNRRLIVKSFISLLSLPFAARAIADAEPHLLTFEEMIEIGIFERTKNVQELVASNNALLKHLSVKNKTDLGQDNA